MKATSPLLLILIAGLAGVGGWVASRYAMKPATATADSGTSGRKILYYQSAMHPWIKSDKPGRCTICGMELSPVFEGEMGFTAGDGLVTLSSNSVQVINVQSEPVSRRVLRRSLRFAGTIDDNDSRHRIVSAYVDGRVDSLEVNYVGAEVVAGDPLATFYSPMLLAAEREYVALGSPPASGLDATAAAAHTRVVESANARLKRFGLSDSQIAGLPSKDPNSIHSALLAPVSGTVVARSIYAGQYVKEGDKLFEIADFSTMWFLFDAYEQDLGWLKLGQRVTVTTPALPGRTYAGTIAFIDPNLKEMTRSALVRVELPNPLIETNGVKRRELYHKLYADAVVTVETPDSLTVPRSAVLSPGPSPLVYVVKGDGVYEQRKIRLGRTGDESFEVLDGLSEGERVVTQGNLLIDAQAQLNAGSAAGSVPPSTTSTAAVPPLTPSQQEAIERLLTFTDRVTAALAADDLSTFNTHATSSHGVVAALASAFPADNAWRASIGRVLESGHLGNASDLKGARKAFHPLSQATVELVKLLRKQNIAAAQVKIFRCPMTKDAFAGAPRTAEWIQFQPAIRNPYFGAEMLDCGSEVKP